ncbi:malonyl CoA-acyl carrier protein transacylase [Streptomyces sp. BK208]|uniref:ACP S-malonyltransferase n=1 Tax=Streptomyces sp. BK208 TaxID=2512150 RepID=UPI00105C9E34|nr:acyltransferase domain-containing protein [Streptomyces sp. BK208]TDT31626.1 malonyl CoA-acyl carrier protein transacylase [Streptomyces sp. BK208]
MDRTAFLFPGQGANVGQDAAALLPGAASVVAEVLDEVDQAGTPFGLGVTRKGAAGSPQLTLYATSVAVMRVLALRGIEPDMALGYSLGEIPALVCAGALSVSDGALGVCYLVRSMRAYEGLGGVALVRGSAEQIQPVLAAGGGEVVIGGYNQDRLLVLTGPGAPLRAVLEEAAEAGLRPRELDVPYMIHHPALAGTVARYAKDMAVLEQRPLRRPVYSPLAGRWYTDDDDLARCLAENVANPVRLPSALVALAQAGATTFVECGPPAGITQAVWEVVGQKHPGARAYCPLSGLPVVS